MSDSVLLGKPLLLLPKVFGGDERPESCDFP